MQLWGSDECIKKAEINAKNRRDGREVVVGTHTGGSISIGEYRKKPVSIYFTNSLTNIFLSGICLYLNTKYALNMIISNN